jgi:hypothetical protein
MAWITYHGTVTVFAAGHPGCSAVATAGNALNGAPRLGHVGELDWPRDGGIQHHPPVVVDPGSLVPVPELPAGCRRRVPRRHGGRDVVIGPVLRPPALLGHPDALDHPEGFHGPRVEHPLAEHHDANGRQDPHQHDHHHQLHQGEAATPEVRPPGHGSRPWMHTPFHARQDIVARLGDFRPPFRPRNRGSGSQVIADPARPRWAPRRPHPGRASITGTGASGT